MPLPTSLEDRLALLDRVAQMPPMGTPIDDAELNDLAAWCTRQGVTATAAQVALALIPPTLSSPIVHPPSAGTPALGQVLGVGLVIAAVALAIVQVPALVHLVQLGHPMPTGLGLPMRGCLP